MAFRRNVILAITFVFLLPATLKSQSLPQEPEGLVLLIGNHHYGIYEIKLGGTVLPDLTVRTNYQCGIAFGRLPWISVRTTRPLIREIGLVVLGVLVVITTGWCLPRIMKRSSCASETAHLG